MIVLLAVRRTATLRHCLWVKELEANEWIAKDLARKEGQIIMPKKRPHKAKRIYVARKKWLPRATGTSRGAAALLRHTNSMSRRCRWPKKRRRLKTSFTRP
jgi:hypothetical protein